MAYRGGRSQGSSVLQVFRLNPLPYPVLLILAVISIFLGVSSYFSYETAVESTEEQLSWVLKVSPIILLISVHLLSSIENPERFFTRSPYDRRRRTYNQSSEGSSPWIVAAVIVLLLVMVSYQSSIIGI